MVTKHPRVCYLSCVDWQWQCLHLIIADWHEQEEEAHVLVVSGLGKTKVTLNIL